MRTHQRFRTVYKKLISSYIIVLCFTIITVSVIMHSYSSRLLKNEMINFGNEVILRIAESLDRQIFNCVETTWIECAVNDSSISNAISSGGDMTHYDYYTLYNDVVKLTSSNNDVISNIEIYISDRKVLVSSKGNGRIKFIENSADVVSEEFKLIVEKGEVGAGWFPANENLMCFYRTVPYIKGSTIPFKGYIAIYVKEEAIADILKSEQSEEAYFSLVDADGEVLMSTGEVLPDAQTIADILNLKERIYYSSTDGYIINAAKLSSTNINLIRMVPGSVYFNKLSNMRIILWSLCLLFVAMGFGISMLFARQIYNPIKHIVNNIRNFTELENDRHVNEYSIIDGTISSLSDKINNLENEVIQNRELLKHKNVIALLAGNSIKDTELNFRYRKFVAAAVLVRDAYNDTEDIMHKIIALLEKGSDNVDFYYVATSPSRIDVVANYAENEFAEVKAVFNGISDFGNQDCDIVVALGDKCDVESISVSYSDAVSCLPYKFFSQSNVLYSHEYLYRELSNEKFSDSAIKAFKSALASGNDKSIYDCVDSLVAEILSSNCSYKQGRGRVYSIFSVFFNYVLEENSNPSYAVTENTFAELNRCATVFSFGEWIKNEIGEFLLGSGERPPITNSDMITAAKHIIEENIDKDISLTFVADKLYIAPSYLSRIFKSETGENFNSYITDRRLELARKLIIETNLSVNVITQKTGFNSATYLIKCFKKKYDQTPVNYKKNYIIEQNGGRNKEV